MTTEVLSFKQDDKVQAAAEAMAKRSIGGAPVVDDAGSVVGMLRDDDLIVSDVRLHLPTVISVLGAYLELPSQFNRFNQEVHKAMGATVGDVMTADPKTCSPDDTVEAVATALHEENVSRLPVVESGKLVGIVSRGDILKEIVKKGP
jgi:CBS domain-containing protein